MPSRHLGVYSRDRGRDYISLMLSGNKTVDIKLYTKRIPPWQLISAGDIMYIKETSGPVVGRVLIPKVSYYEITNPEQTLGILLSIWREVGLDSEEHALNMYEKVWDRRYVTVFHLAEPVTLQKPVSIEKRDRRVWVPYYRPPLEVLLSFGENPESVYREGKETSH